MNRLRPRWFSGMQLQLALLFTLAVVLAQVISISIVFSHNSILQDAVNRFRLLERTAADVKLINLVTLQQRELAVTALSEGRKRILLGDVPWQMMPDTLISELQQRFAEIAELPISRVQFSTEVLNQDYCQDDHKYQQNSIYSGKPCKADLFVSAQLDDKVWLNFYFDLGPPSKQLLAKVTPGVILTLFSVIAITSITLKRITRPLNLLSQAAEKVGRGESCQLPASGPEDVKKTIHAFNEMQEKVNLYIKDRTFLMAAISHDLHTPITTMRLRIELLPESEDKKKLLETLDEMEAITSASLDFVYETNIDEVNKEVDINALLSSICDDLKSSGLRTNYYEQERVVYSCRSKALKRALTNLISNGAIYGQQAQVELKTNTEQLQIFITDQGKGIPENMHERIFEPFVRLEQSRNRETGGTGLGMSIARTIVRHHGGGIELLNHADRFTVIVILPKMTNCQATIGRDRIIQTGR